MVSATGAAGDSSNHLGVFELTSVNAFFRLFNVTNFIIFFFIHTLTHYVITRFLRFPEGFLLYAVAILSLVLVRKT